MKKILLIISAVLIAAAAQAGEPVWKNIFDGKTLKGWKTLGGTATFTVEKGTIVGHTSKTPGEKINTFLCTEKPYGNYNLEFEFKVDEELNSGVMLRGIFSDGLVRGYQYEIDPSSRKWTGGIYDEKRRGWLCDLSDNPEAGDAFKPGKWNSARVEANKDGIRTYINGVLASSLVDFMTPNGFIGLQVHWQPEYKNREVSFRNIRIQDLGLNDESAAETPDKWAGEWTDPSHEGVVVQAGFDKQENNYKLIVCRQGYLQVAPDAVLVGKPEGKSISYSNQEGWTASYDGKIMNVTGPDFKFSGKKSGRRSPTLGAVPPAGATVLFDGNDLSAWGGLAPKEWLEWSVDAAECVKVTPAGDIEMIPGKQSIVTKRYFGDMKKLHLEFRLLGDVTNGGVYLMSRWEFNVKDSWCNRNGDPVGSFGNIDGMPAKYNWALPTMEWQTMDIEFTAPRFDEQGPLVQNARVTMYLNGELMYEDVELSTTKGAGGGRRPIPAEAPLYLQEHGTAYQFRNIWVVE